MLKSRHADRTTGRQFARLATVASVTIALTLLWAPPASHAQTPVPPAAHSAENGTTTPPSAPEPAAASASEQASPAVELIKPRRASWDVRIAAQGNILPWQETHISSEVGGLRVISVLVNTGDAIKKGQTLARLNAGPVETELDTANAQLIEAKAALAQATATLDRANRLAPSGGVSKQELSLYETQKHTAEARLAVARAVVKKQQTRLDFATIAAPDDGIISSRSVAEGAIVQSGSELFRIIRQGRLQWRAEVSGEQLLKLSIGQDAVVKSPLGETIQGRIRQVSPTIDPKTQKGWAMVDLPQNTNLKAGLSVSGELTVGQRDTLTLPASAVQTWEGISQIFRLSRDNRIEAIQIKTGETKDGLVEILSSLDEQTPVVARNLEHLKVGETVSVRGTAAGGNAPDTSVH